MTGPVAAHRAAYAAWIEARARSFELHENFDPDHEISEDPDAIRAALTTIHGPYAAEEIERYQEADRAANEAARAEDAAWAAVSSATPATAADLRAWVAYVVEHSARGDEAVTLRRALEHMVGLLADRG